MRHRLELIDLENPQVRLPSMCLEERIMIGAQMPRHALTPSGSAEHAAQVDRRDIARMHAEAHQTTRELIHDHEHPVGSQYEGFAGKQVDAPEAARRVADERQPRGSSAARRRAIVFGQYAMY